MNNEQYTSIEWVEIKNGISGSSLEDFCQAHTQIQESKDIIINFDLKIKQ